MLLHNNVAQKLSRLSATDGQEKSHGDGSLPLRKVRLEGLAALKIIAVVVQVVVAQVFRPEAFFFLRRLWDLVENTPYWSPVRFRDTASRFRSPASPASDRPSRLSPWAVVNCSYASRMPNCSLSAGISRLRSTPKEESR